MPFGHRMGVVIHIVTGILTMDSLLMAVKILPVCLLGLYAGIFVSTQFKEGASRKIVIVPLVVSGISMIAMNL